MRIGSYALILLIALAVGGGCLSNRPNLSEREQLNHLIASASNDAQELELAKDFIVTLIPTNRHLLAEAKSGNGRIVVA